MDGIGDGVSKVFSRLFNAANEEPGDYYDSEGFLMCGNCHDRKQAYDAKLSEILGKDRTIRPRLCKCKLEEMERERKLQAEKDRIERIEYLKKRGLADPQYLRYRIENDDRANPKLSDAIIRYTDKWEEMKEKNMGILFCGGVGTGKTFLAGCIANILIEKGIPVLMTNIPALIAAMAKDFEVAKIDILNRVSNVPLLILDDLGTERNTEYGYEKLQEIIDTRYRSGKPLIVTTNLSPEEFECPQDIRYSRVYDRIREMCVTIAVKGESRRKDKARKNREDFKQMILEL